MATSLVITRLETEIDAESETPFTTLVVGHDASDKTPLAFTVTYSDPDGLVAAIIATPVNDVTEIVDFDA